MMENAAVKRVFSNSIEDVPGADAWISKDKVVFSYHCSFGGGLFIPVEFALAEGESSQLETHSGGVVASVLGVFKRCVPSG